MTVEIFLIVVVPVIVITTVLYALVSEMRHNSVRRTRWDLRTGLRPGRGHSLELADTGRE